MSMRTPLSRVRGLGSARQGTEHFWQNTVTSVALIPLTVVFVGIVIAAVGRSHADAVRLLGSPLVAIALLALILAGVRHMQLGMQVIIEDYVNQPLLRVLALMANSFFSALVGIASAIALIKITFGA